MSLLRLLLRSAVTYRGERWADRLQSNDPETVELAVKVVAREAARHPQADEAIGKLLPHLDHDVAVRLQRAIDEERSK